jgi:anaerobic dimethyl sulfoxide reductase subunit A
MTSVPVFCGKDCGGNACPMMATVEHGRVTRILHNPAGGQYLKACQRGFNLQLETYAPDRLLHPLVRVGARGSGQYRRASWEEALQITADRLGEIRARYGASAVLNRGSAGVVGAMHATYAVLPRFLNLFGGCTQLSMGYSSAAAGYILPYLFGAEWTRTGFDAATMRQAEMIILWGANVLETRQGTAVIRADLRRSGRRPPVGLPAVLVRMLR